MLGYTLNGYYLVKGKGESINSKVQTVYCQFKQPPIVKNGKHLFQLKTKTKASLLICTILLLLF